ncbi:TolC family protein [Paludibacter jiangxiensis]|uniref:Outer membrane protein n=1 Tax=Paludibacter jiangxiensis TaxID=681398 RepID=A0A161M5C0_9BACT|nr:TolC family protein [Paludibacter jiangxiensis]GAT63523.1 outer membrane protein [Paludibacter jiangxiensis]
MFPTKIILGLLIGIGCSLQLSAQQKPAQWDLKSCIDYALKNNIQIQKSKIGVSDAKVDLLTAKAAQLPSLDASVSQTFTNSRIAGLSGSYHNNSNVAGRYSVSSSMTLWNGGRISKNIEQQGLQVQLQELSSSSTENDITTAITQAYLNVLYANEAVKIGKQTVESSEAQLKRAKQLLDAGSTAMNDYAQVETQLSSDKYSLTSSQNTLDQAKLTLKQLLELDINEELNIAFPDIKDEEVLQPVADKSQIYNTALSSRPEIKSGQMNIKVAQLSLDKSKAAYYPTVSLSGSIGTGNIYNSNEKFTTQLSNSLAQSLGVTVSIPIFNNRQNKSAVEKAEYAIKNAQLDYTAAQKTLLKNIETTYQDVISSQSRYVSAKDKVKSSEISYSLINDQFNLGMKNTVELLNAKNTYQSAQMELLQAKFSAVLNLKLLNFYQNIPIQ